MDDINILDTLPPSPEPDSEANIHELENGTILVDTLTHPANFGIGFSPVSQQQTPDTDLKGRVPSAPDKQHSFTLIDHPLNLKFEGPEGCLKLIDTMDCLDGILCCRFSPNGSLVAAGTAAGSIKVFGIDTQECLYSLTDHDLLKRRASPTSVRFPSFSKQQHQYQHYLLATYVTGEVRLWHYSSETTVIKLQEDRPTNGCAYNSDLQRFVTCGESEDIFVYDAETWQPINTCSPSEGFEIMDGHRLRVFSVIYTPNNPHVFISGGWDDTVHFWDDRQKHSMRRLYGPHICGDALDIDPVHSHILTGSWRAENPLQIWDFGSGKLIKNVKLGNAHRTMAYCSQWLGKDDIMCGGGEQNLALIFDRSSLTVSGTLGALNKAIYCMDSDQRGQQPSIAIGSGASLYLCRKVKYF